MDLRGVKMLNAKGPWIDGPNCRDGIASDAANQVIQEVIKLEHLVRILSNVGSFENWSYVGSCGKSAHANSNAKAEH